MLREIGSEFWMVETTEELDSNLWWEHMDCSCLKYYMSGRTALFAVANDIKVSFFDRFPTIALPFYCCESMILPFKRCGFNIEYYDSLDQITCNCDVVFALEYFGYQNDDLQDLLSYLSNKGKIIVQDVTHSLFQDKPVFDDAKYVVASLRKWSGFVTGGFAIKRNGQINSIIKDPMQTLFYNERVEAQREKNLYIQGVNLSKESFLDRFASAENSLDKHFEFYSMDEHSKALLSKWDVNRIKESRRRNANYLYENISLQKKYNYSFGSTPLFVPVVLSSSKERNGLQKYLIENGVFCPVHWQDNENDISLICDQRYSIDDMKYEVELINNYLKR